MKQKLTWAIIIVYVISEVVVEKVNKANFKILYFFSSNKGGRVIDRI